MEKPRIKISYKNKIKVIELLDDKILDEATLADLTESLFSVLTEEETPNIVINFSRVMQMSSSMLGILIRLNKRVAEKGGNLKLCCIIPMLYDIFVLTKINKLFEIYHDEQTAINSFE
jgi:anti-sigma B factor antagonist